MKIAAPSRSGRIDDHFGHCESFTILTTDENQAIVKEEILMSPQSCGCKSGIVSELKNLGVSVMLAGNMGPGAAEKLTNAGIRVIRGCSGNVRDVAEAFLKNQITDNGESCNAHGSHHHSCDH